MPASSPPRSAAWSASAPTPIPISISPAASASATSPFFQLYHYGGGAAAGTVQQAALAVHAGVADVVVCYRAFNERSGSRLGAGVQGRPPMANAESAHLASYLPVGLLTPASWVAMAAQRYLHVNGATSEDLGRVAVADRKHAATNPRALVLRAADHAGAAPGQPLHRRSPPPARLLPGDRRGAGPRHHLPGAGPRPPEHAGGDRPPPCRAQAPART